MAKKKQNNKKKHYKKIQGTGINKTKENYLKTKDENIKVKRQLAVNKKHKYYLIPLFFLFSLTIMLTLGYKNNNTTKIIDVDLFKIKIDMREFNLVRELCKEKDYDINNLKRYLDYIRENNIPLYHAIVIVNNNLDNIEYNDNMKNIIENKNFISTNLRRYLEYYDKYKLSVDKTILAVNNDLDKNNIKLTNTIESFIKQTYFIKDNLNRYLDYYKKNKNLKFKEIVTRVNSNLDKTFYADITKSDTSKGDLLLVNKYYYLDNDYIPKNLVDVSSKHGRGELKKVTYNAFIKMYDDAVKEGLYLYISSPYRSYSYQQTLYDNYASIDGVKQADKYSARPGYSEHQTGLAFDLGTTSNHDINEFANSREFKWVQKNAHKYGFILRYPYGKTYITGYIYEPWHYRYVGVDIATYIYENNVTYEEYYAYFIQ